MAHRIFCGLFMASLGAFAQDNVVQIQPGDNIQALVEANPEGTTFSFSQATYRLVHIVPKNGDIFVGNGASLNGSWLLTDFYRYGRLWAIGGQTQHGRVVGSCQSDRPKCAYPEDLFFDDLPLPQAASIEETQPGQWFFDYPGQTVYLGSDPAGHKVEIGTRAYAFSGSASNVTIQQFVIEKYAVPAQSGAINPHTDAQNWSIVHNEIRWNHAWGLRLTGGMQVTGNYIHDNGQLGVGGGGDNILLDTNDISANNYAGFDPGWEAGGTKFVATNNLVVRGNAVYANFGTGLWTDTDNRQTRYESNRVFDNMGPGIQHEISFDAVIVQNDVRNNGKGGSPWLWGAQILIQNSSHAEVANNYVEVGSGVGNGIALIQQDRGSYVTTNNYVHDNTVVYRGTNGQSGAVADFNPAGIFGGNNHFDFNIYHSPDAGGTHWAWADSLRTWEDFKRLGQEPNGNADAKLPQARSAPGRPGREILTGKKIASLQLAKKRFGSLPAPLAAAGE